MLTHADLVARAARWLRGTCRCKTVFTELVSGRETADAIGFTTGGWSILVECKTSTSDFYSDQQKFVRREPNFGLGDLRYYLCEAGVIELGINKLPDKWGLLHAVGRSIFVKREPTNFEAREGKRSEVQLLGSALRRLQIAYEVPQIKSYREMFQDARRKGAGLA